MANQGHWGWDDLSPDEIMSDLKRYTSLEHGSAERAANLESDWYEAWSDYYPQDLVGEVPIDKEILGQETNTFLNLTYNQDEYTHIFEMLDGNHSEFISQATDLGFDFLDNANWDPHNLWFMVKEYFHGKYGD